MNSGDLLNRAATLSRASFDMMSHCMGWPDTAKARRRPGRIKWAHPYRNGFSTEVNDPRWEELRDRGLAYLSHVGESGYAYWSLTPLGIAVTRIRLRALLEVRVDMGDA